MAVGSRQEGVPGECSESRMSGKELATGELAVGSHEVVSKK
jgi:hypothetical protein